MGNRTTFFRLLPVLWTKNCITRETGKRRQVLTVGTRRAWFAILRIESTQTTTEDVKPIIFWSTGNASALGKGVKSNNTSIGVYAAPWAVYS